jgi:hypothetical protein
VGALLRAGLVAAACLAWAGCGPSHANIPPIPPEVQAVAAEYDDPTGTVPLEAMMPLTDLEQTVGTLEATGLRDVVADLLSAVEKRVADSGLPTDPLTHPKAHRPVIAGSVTFDRICKGWDDSSTTPDPANGSITATVVFQSGVLQRTLWGTATNCHERVPGPGGVTIHALFDGSYAVFLEGPLESDSSKASFLMAWNGAIGTEATGTAQVAFDFRVVPPSVEVRVPVSDGSVIGSIGANGVSVRGANGTFICSLETFTCLPST